MMIKHSSSQLEPTVLLDSISRPVHMGKQIGRGGEGGVYEVAGNPSLLAKIYHKKPLPEEQVAKLQAMVSCWSQDLETIAAWPRALLFDPVSRKPSGILMTMMDGAHQLHELYGTTNRRRHFPEVGWHHLVLAARNTAAAFQTLHSGSIVVGDVNQGNLLVDKGMCVRMIDCDSFQLTAAGRTFNCPVGTPHFTPPELQSQKLRNVVRTVCHDRFGLAVLIFHLLFVGRHPFAGRFRGVGDLSIEKAIAERRFAFSNNRSETLVDPPPASLLLSDLPDTLGELFERAFRNKEEDGSDRPGAREWGHELDLLLKRRKNCSFDSAHVYFSGLDECPWCRIEDSGGPSFFVPAGGVTIATTDRLASLDMRILELPEAKFPDLSSEQLALPNMPVLRRLKEMPKRTWTESLADLVAASWAACFVGAFLGGFAGHTTLAAGTILSLALITTLIFSKQAAARRKTKDDFDVWLENGRQTLAKRAQVIDFHYKQREQVFDRSKDTLKNETHLYRNAADNLRDVIVQLRESQRADFLRSFMIRDYMRKIPGLTASQVTIMESYGVETANDVERLKLYGVPGLDPETIMEILQWRREVEPGFVFNPEHGLTLENVGAAKELAVRRFKLSQGRKILAASKQLQTLADVAKSELSRALQQFEQYSEQWLTTAKQCRDFQSGRRQMERFLNRSVPFIISVELGMLFAAGLIRLIIG
jgi:DNA-binding helix-hairpin-helix protein with protein kinase domain